MKDKLLDFLDTTFYYETARLFGLLPSDGRRLRTFAVAARS